MTQLSGLDAFVARDYKRFQKTRLAILCHPASVTRNLTHISEALTAKSLRLNVTSYFGPQHGIRGEKQDNMVESEDFLDPRSGKPVYSLYSSTRVPTDSMYENFDVLLVDLQDIGTRIYTFMYTLANCMRVASRLKKKVVVLDRPNPLGGLQTEGNLLDERFTSFVGQFPMCTRHGLTMGELAQFFNAEFSLGCDLEVIPLKGFSRKLYGNAWHRQWIPPSPNIPRFEAAVTFPGTVHFEGTNISEGRGTTMPFEFIGAPYVTDPDQLARKMNQKKLPGVYFRPIFFQPTYHKGKDQVCGGVQLHLLNVAKFNAFEAGILLLEAIFEDHRAAFKWKQPPYEYEFDKQPIDLIAGTDALRLALESGKGVKSFLRKSREDAASFKKKTKKYLLY